MKITKRAKISKTKKTQKIKGGVIPTFKTTQEGKDLYDPFIYDKNNVFYDGVLIHYNDEYKETLELKNDFSAFLPHELTESDKNIYEESQNINVYSFSTKDDLQIKLFKSDKSKDEINSDDINLSFDDENKILDDEINLLDLKLFDICSDFKNKINEMLTNICSSNKEFEKFIKNNNSPFSIIRNTTNFNELRKGFNLFNKYTFLNKFYELLDILLNTNSDEEIKNKLMEIYDNNEIKFVNCCDYMTFLNNFGQYKNLLQNDKNYSDKNVKAKEYIHEYYSKKNGFTKDLKKYDDYLKDEIKLIKMYKKDFIDVIKNSTTKECKEISEDIGMDMVSFTILFYIYQRINHPSLFIADLGIDLFQISKKKFISNLLQDRPFKIVILNDYFYKYPKITNFQCKLKKDNSFFPACAERGLFEFVKFISFNDKDGSFVAPEGVIINKDIENYINKNSVKIFESKTDDTELFTEFNNLISGDNKFSDINYNKLDYNIPANKLQTVLKKIINFDKLQSKENIVIEKTSSEIKLSNKKTNIILTILINPGHVEVNFSKINYDVDFKLINNISLKLLVAQCNDTDRIILEKLDTTKVTKMNDFFNGFFWFNQNIGKWNTENVTDMNNMFKGCSNFNQDISEWKTGNVTNMSEMFKGCSNFNQDIRGWDTKNVTNMSGMFKDCSNFNKFIGRWNTGNVTNMSEMFNGCHKFNLNIGNLDTKNVTNMSGMFNNCVKFNQDIGHWKTEKVTDMNNMFNYCSNFNQDIGNWKTENVTKMNEMFNYCSNFNQDIGRWKTENVKDMSYMFNGCENFNQDISNWNTENVIDMKRMFHGCANFNQDISNWNTKSVENTRNISNMFDYKSIINNEFKPKPTTQGGRYMTRMKHETRFYNKTRRIKK